MAKELHLVLEKLDRLSASQDILRADMLTLRRQMDRIETMIQHLGDGNTTSQTPMLDESSGHSPMLVQSLMALQSQRPRR